jgi:FMN phosphatase YigB (HAD superfamily)
VPVHAVLFDLFDTLVDLRVWELPRIEILGREVPASIGRLHEITAERAPVDQESFFTALRETDQEFRETHFRHERELNSLERFTALTDRLGLVDPELPHLLTDAHMSIFRDYASLPEHHAGVLSDLGKRVRLGLCSNFSHAETAHRILTSTGLRLHLDTVAISDAVGIRKPRREIFQAALLGVGAAPEEALHVGDSLHADVAGAAALGIRTVWITRRVEDPEQQLREYDGPPPCWRIRDLAELPGVLDEAIAAA